MGESSVAKLGVEVGKKQLKKDQRIGYHREFKASRKSSSKKSKKNASRKVK